MNNPETQGNSEHKTQNENKQRKHQGTDNLQSWAMQTPPQMPKVICGICDTSSLGWYVVFVILVAEGDMWYLWY
jgi:hypothetical protein